MLREPPSIKQEYDQRQEVRELKKYLKEVDSKHARLVWQYEALQEQMKTMTAKMEDMDKRLR